MPTGQIWEILYKIKQLWKKCCSLLYLIIGAVAKFYFSILNQFRKHLFYLWNPQKAVHTFENHVGVLFIKHDGVGATMILVRLFWSILVWYCLDQLYMYRFQCRLYCGYYSTLWTVQFVDIFHVDIIPQIHAILIVFFLFWSKGE
jgi:hypothetical protein